MYITVQQTRCKDFANVRRSQTRNTPRNSRKFAPADAAGAKAVPFLSQQLAQVSEGIILLW
jgi:hypothetical protein